MIKEPRIIFMGTPEFAVPSLGSLLMNNYDVVAVVSSQDKPAGRGLNIRVPEVAQYARENYLYLLQPENLKDPPFVEKIKSLKPDIIIVVAFRKIPEEIWSIPSLGTFNLHASLLPQYRGAAPINHAIINGENMTGLTTFLIDNKIDTGNILFRKSVNIGQDDTAGNLHDRLMREGAKLVIKTLKALVRDTAKPKDQNSFIKNGEVLKTAPKIHSKDCYINWDRPNNEVYNFIRGLSPFPGARTVLRKGDRNYIIKIGKCKCTKRANELAPAQIESDGKEWLRIGTKGCSIEVEKIQMEGRKMMSAAEFLRGFSIEGTEILKDPRV